MTTTTTDNPNVTENKSARRSLFSGFDKEKAFSLIGKVVVYGFATVSTVGAIGGTGFGIRYFTEPTTEEVKEAYKEQLKEFGQYNSESCLRYQAQPKNPINLDGHNTQNSVITTIACPGSTLEILIAEDKKGGVIGVETRYDGQSTVLEKNKTVPKIFVENKEPRWMTYTEGNTSSP